MSPTLSPVTRAPATVRRGLYWELAGGEAMGFAVPQRGELRVVRGRVWATTDGPHGRREGDHVLGPGDALLLAADRRLVVESWSGQPARVEWQALPAERAVSPSFLRAPLMLFSARLGAWARLLSRALAGWAPPRAH